MANEPVNPQLGQIGELIEGFKPPEGPEVKPPDEVKGPDEVKAPDEVKPPEVKPEEKKEEEKPTDAIIKPLLDQIKALQAQVTELAKPKEKAPEKPPEKPEEVLGLGYFKDKAEYEAAFEKPEVMSEVMTRVKRDTIKEVLKAIPPVLDNMIKTQIQVHGKIDKFFVENEDLIQHKEFAGFVANDLSGRNPDWDMNKLFNELPGEVRKRLGLKQEAPKPKPKPAFVPGKTGSRVPTEKKTELSPLEQEIADLIS